MSPQPLTETILEEAGRHTLAVLGDLMLDEWIVGSASRISPEAPVPVVRFQNRVTAPGGAANVAMNLLSLGARVRVGGVVGDDEAGKDLARELEGAGAATNAVVLDVQRPTTLKTRIVAQHQQMVRVDRESDGPLGRATLKSMRDNFPKFLEGAAVLCISDYDKGLAASGAVMAAINAARAAGVRVTGGPKPHNLGCFARADFLSLNQKEAGEASGIKLDSTEAVTRCGAGLLELTEATALVITRGSLGVSLFVQGQSPQHIPAHVVEVFDVAGAGDTFLAAATLALATGTDFLEATKFGNLAAAASVRHVGVIAVTPDDVRGLHHPAPSHA
jgi:D-beta-D-heptose 7-phosphate kinase/D-beta-D-heptose 1-phosphate adenosyltransferase